MSNLSDNAITLAVVGVGALLVVKYIKDKATESVNPNSQVNQQTGAWLANTAGVPPNSTYYLRAKQQGAYLAVADNFNLGSPIHTIQMITNWVTGQ